MNLSHITIPSAWQNLAEEIGRNPGTVLLLGGTDSGKSTLARFLSIRCYEMGLRTALVDSDIGQSLLGLPATVTSTPIVSRECLDRPPLLFQFVGAVSPRGHIPQLILSLEKVMNRVRELGPQVIVVDTTGFIYGDAARDLKERKVDLLHPTHIVALQHTDEVEHLIACPKAQEALIHRLVVCDEVRRRSQEERRHLREEKFGRYFRESKVVEVDIRGVALYETGFQSGQKIPERTLHTLPQIVNPETLHTKGSTQKSTQRSAQRSAQRNAQEVTLILAGTSSAVPTPQLYSLFDADRARAVEAQDFAHYLVGLHNERNESLALGIVKQLIPKDRKMLIYTPMASLSSVSTIEFGFLRLRLSGQELDERQGNQGTQGG